MKAIRKGTVTRYFVMLTKFMMTLTIIECGIIIAAVHNQPGVGLTFIGIGFMIFVSLLLEVENASREITFYIDMDGCLAQWKEASEIELLGSEHYRNLTPEYVLMQTATLLLRNGNNVIFLTKVMNEKAIEGKKWWLRYWGLDMFPVIFVPYDRSKSEYIKNRKGIKVLLDDYSKNLREWEKAGKDYVSVKFRNRINGTHGTWEDKPTVFYCQTAENICRLLIAAGLNRRYAYFS